MASRLRPAVVLLALLLASWLITTCALPEDGLLGDASSIVDVVTQDVQSDPIEEMQLDSGLDTAPDVLPDVVVPLSPDQIPTGLEFWVRSDSLVTDDAGALVLEWPDMSGKGDPNRNAFPAPKPPPAVLVDAGYGWPVVNFAGDEWLQTGQWANGPFVQPVTVFIVGGGTYYFMDSTDPTSQFCLLGISGDLRMYAGSYVSNGGATTGKRVIIGVFNGLNSTLHNSQTSPTSVGNPGTHGLKGVTLGLYSGGGATYSLAGSLAEVAIWSRALPGTEIASLNAYAAARYQLTIAP